MFFSICVFYGAGKIHFLSCFHFINDCHWTWLSFKECKYLDVFCLKLHRQSIQKIAYFSAHYVSKNPLNFTLHGPLNKWCITWSALRSTCALRPSITLNLAFQRIVMPWKTMLRVSSQHGMEQCYHSTAWSGVGVHEMCLLWYLSGFICLIGKRSRKVSSIIPYLQTLKKPCAHIALSTQSLLRASLIAGEDMRLGTLHWTLRTLVLWSLSVDTSAVCIK